MNTLVTISPRIPIREHSTGPEWFPTHSGRAEFLDELVAALAGCSSQEEFADRVVSLVIKHTAAESCSLMLVDGDSGDLTIAGAKARAERERRDTVGSPVAFKVGEGIAGWVASTKTPVRLGDATRDHRFLAVPSSITVKSLMSFPIATGERTLGVLNMSSPVPGVFTGEDEQLMAAASRHIARGLEHTGELAQLRARLLQSEKMSAAGNLLAGIVHELNSPLTTILGFSELLLQAGMVDSKLEKIRAEAERSVRIIRNVLSVSRRGNDQPGRFDVNEAIRQSVELAEHQIRLCRIDLRINLSGKGPKVIAHPGELTQVLLNLVTNAIQAINALKPWGKIEISSAVVGDRVRISVADDGPGIREKNLGRIFETFFTTKETGTGLGLSLSRKIIRDNGGDMWVSSVESCGSTFTIELPVAEEETGRQQRRASDRPLSTSARSVLVVDDEDYLAELVQSVLEKTGYSADRLNDGASAMELLKKKNYDLLICDLHMPGASGRDVIEWVRSSGRPMQVLVLTGDVVRPETREFVKNSGAHFLSKPFSISELAKAVEQIVG